MRTSLGVALFLLGALGTWVLWRTQPEAPAPSEPVPPRASDPPPATPVHAPEAPGEAQAALERTRAILAESWAAAERERGLDALFSGLLETEGWNPDVLAAWRKNPAAKAAADGFLAKLEAQGAERERFRAPIFRTLLASDEELKATSAAIATAPVEKTAPGVRNALSYRLAHSPTRALTPVLVGMLQAASSDELRLDRLSELLQWPDPACAPGLLEWLRTPAVQASPRGANFLKEILGGDLWQEARLRAAVLERCKEASWFREVSATPTRPPHHYDEVGGDDVSPYSVAPARSPPPSELAVWVDRVVAVAPQTSARAAAWLGYGKLFAFSSKEVEQALSARLANSQATVAEAARQALELFRKDTACIEALARGEGKRVAELAAEAAALHERFLDFHERRAAPWMYGRDPGALRAILEDPRSDLRVGAAAVLLAQDDPGQALPSIRSGPDGGPASEGEAPGTLRRYLEQVHSQRAAIRAGRILEDAGQVQDFGARAQKARAYLGDGALQAAREALGTLFQTAAKGDPAVEKRALDTNRP